MNMEVKISVKPVDYIKSMEILERRVNDVHNGKKDEFLWILEHNDIYTGGTSSKTEDLLDKKIKIIKTNRGGKYTFHGKGQKVVYFVINLNKRKKDIRVFVRKIEKCIIKILNEYKVQSYADKKNIGIWINNKNNLLKIAAIGIRVRKWIAYHGFSINIENDLSKYKKIVPCGIRDKGITSLKSQGIDNYKNINDTIVKSFLNTFA
jgi:lipoyl(octanoyl) transferase